MGLSRYLLRLQCSCGGWYEHTSTSYRIGVYPRPVGRCDGFSRDERAGMTAATEYTNHNWPVMVQDVAIDGESIMEHGVLNADDYERARLAVAYCAGISNETLASIVKCNQKLSERAALLKGKST